MKLMGVDVGFSKRRKATGIACLDGNKLHLSKAGSSWESRKAQIPAGFQPTVIALDGPLLPQGANELVRRRCEFLFTYAPFCGRCKPGLSHWGMGLELRHAAAKACAQFARVLGDSTPSPRKMFVSCDGPIVEAFPNAFLAVLMPEDEFCSSPKLKRGKRFDWLYKRAVVNNEYVKSSLSTAINLPDEVWRQLSVETDHDRRAALVCLLTAALAAQGTASVVGDAEGGWFWLPPMSLWQGWAREGLSRAAEKWRAARQGGS
jgi:hypothetical protein